MAMSHKLCGPLKDRKKIRSFNAVEKQGDLYKDLYLLVQTFIDGEILDKRGRKKVRMYPKLDTDEVTSCSLEN